MSEEVMLQSKEKQIEQQEGRHGKRHKVDKTYNLELREEAIGTGEWGVKKRKPEHHEPVKNAEENPTREENQEGNQGLSVKPRKTDVEPSGDVQEDCESFSVEPRSMQIWVSEMFLRLSKWR